MEQLLRLAEAQHHIIAHGAPHDVPLNLPFLLLLAVLLLLTVSRL